MSLTGSENGLAAGLRIGEDVARRRLVLFAWLALVGVFLIETGVSLVVFNTPMDERPFPQGYVSRGIWSAYGLVRPPDATSTDIAPTLTAAQRVLHGDNDLYRDFKRSGSSYIYPPTTAIELAPFGWLVDRFSLGRAVQAMDVAGRLATVVLLWVCIAVVRPSLARRRDWIVLILVAMVFFPLRWSIFCVQAQTLINACLACAMLAYARSHDRTCGVLIGLASCMKPHFALLVVFACVRRRWGVAVAAIATGVAFVAASVFIVGFDAWVTYVTEVMPKIADGYAWHANQSFNGLARRWMGESGTFDLLPAQAGVRAFSWCASIVFIVLSVIPRIRRTRTPCAKRSMLLHAADFGIATLALTLASPIAWNHHYGWSVALFAVCVMLGCATRVGLRYVLLLALSFVLVGTSWSPLADGYGGIASLVDSKMLWGGLILLVTGWLLCAQREAASGAN